MAMNVRPATLEDLPVLLDFEQGIIKAERPHDPLLKPDPIRAYEKAGFSPYLSEMRLGLDD